MPTYPLGKLPAQDLAHLLAKYAPADPRLIVGGTVGEDAAVIDMGDRYLVAKTDPITFATDEIGWYAVNINANDIACTGATPRWFLATLLLPENKSTPALVDSIFAQIYTACAAMNITVAGGHTEITYGLDRPIVIGQMLGEVSPQAMITTSGAKIGDDLILSKGIAIEATAIIASEMREQLLDHFAAADLDSCVDFLHNPGISVVEDAAIATSVGGVHALHDPTEGGIATGLYELAETAKVGLEIFENKLPFLPQTLSLCQHFDLNPLGVIASGSLLISANPTSSGQIIQQLQQANINATVIGRVCSPQQGCHLINFGDSYPLPTFARDEITKLFE